MIDDKHFVPRSEIGPSESSGSPSTFSEVVCNAETNYGTNGNELRLQ